MPAEYQDSPKQKKPASGPKNGPAKRNRSTKRLSGYRPKARNALYQLAAEFKRRHPRATAADAWRHLIAVAATGAHPIIVAHDRAADVLEYRPDIEKIATRSIKFASFASRLSRLA
jgi:hypothetical protein